MSNSQLYKGDNVKRFREIQGIQQEALACALGEDRIPKKNIAFTHKIRRMKRSKYFLFVVVIMVCLQNVAIINAFPVSPAHKVIFENVIQNYTDNSSFDYSAIYVNKCFDCDTNIYFKYNVTLQVVPADTIFGCYFWYHSVCENVAVYKFYDGKALYVVDTSEKTCTKFNISAGQTSPIKGSFDGHIVEVAPFFKPDILRKILYSEKGNTQRQDTVIDNTPCIAVKSVFEFDNKKNNQKRTIYINCKTFQIERITIITTLENQTEIKDIVYSNFIFKKISTDSLSQLFAACKKKDIKELAYQPRNRDLLQSGSSIDSIKGWLYPDKEAIMIPENGRITVLDFWYTACAPCAKSIPDLNKLYAKYRGKVDFYGVNPDDNDIQKPDRVANFLKRTPIHYPIILADWDALGALKIRGFPTLYIIDKKGKLFSSQLGFSENGDSFYKMIDEKLTELLSTK